MSKYVFTKEMRKVSGMGDNYEKECQKMLRVGLEWLDANSGNLRASECTNVVGAVTADNPYTEKMMEAIAACVPGCTGGMMHAVVGHIVYIQKNGWDEYVKKSEKENKN